MKAVILAAGKGTRMKELTSELPKPMLRVQGKPILEHIVAGVVAAGIREIFIVTGWRADVIENHFGDGKKFGAQISFGRQLVQDGTGKAPELAKDFVGASPFLLTYGDILVAPETYPQMLRRFGEGDFAGVITVTPGEDVTKGGLNFFDDQFCLKLLVEKPSREQLEQLRRDGWNSHRACKNRRAANTNSPTPSTRSSPAGKNWPVWKFKAAGWTCAIPKRWRNWKQNRRSRGNETHYSRRKTS
jgi:NDP-sugar pyrophosphorylase family protein